IRSGTAWKIFLRELNRDLIGVRVRWRRRTQLCSWIVMKTKSHTKPHLFHIPVDRRRFFKSMALASAGFSLSGYLAEALTQSPIVTQGPYYPLADDIPLDKDNDLVQVNDNLTAAAGVITYISGRVLDANGNPIKNALVELWHADREGDYLYST